jgi:hypothetical protein
MQPRSGHPENIFAELGLLANDQFALHALFLELYKKLDSCAKSKMLPRKEPTLTRILQLISCAFFCRSSFKENHFYPPDEDPDELYELLPVSMGPLVDRQMAALEGVRPNAPEFPQPSKEWWQDLLSNSMGIHLVLVDALSRADKFDKAFFETLASRLQGRSLLRNRDFWETHTLWLCQVVQRLNFARKSSSDVHNGMLLALFFFDTFLADNLDMSAVVWEAGVRLLASFAVWRAAKIIPTVPYGGAPAAQKKTVGQDVLQRLSIVARRYGDLEEPQCISVWAEMLKVFQPIASPEELETLTSVGPK